MSSMYYSAAWTECGCFISCWHEHKTVLEAASCIPCAGGYVVAVENNAMRSLTTQEEVEFQCAVIDNPPVRIPPVTRVGIRETPCESLPPRGEKETLLEFVLRFLASEPWNQG